MAITRIGVQPVIASAGQGAGLQTYKVGEIAGEGESASETLSLEVGCTNDLSVPGNRNVVHWQGEGNSYRVYKAAGGVFGLIGTTDSDLFIDANIAPDTAQQPPEG